MISPLTEDHRKFLARCKAAGVETDITKRWETGTPHHPKSEETADFLDNIDWLFCSDFFCWKFGGDGDNGEFLLYELDIMYELLDIEAKKGE